MRAVFFYHDVIILRVRWYLRDKLSLRDLVDMMAERRLSLAHTTILRWVRRATPEFARANSASRNSVNGYRCQYRQRGAAADRRQLTKIDNRLAIL